VVFIMMAMQSLLRMILLLSMFAAGVACAQESGTWTIVEERWYVLELDGRRAGHARELVERNGGFWRSSAEQSLRVRRGPGGEESSIAIRTATVETDGGDVVSIAVERRFSDVPQTIEWRFDGDRVAELSRQAGREHRRELPRPGGEWLSPRRAAAFEEAHRRAGDDTFIYRAIDTSEGLAAVSFTHARGDTLTVSHEGRDANAVAWTITRAPDDGGDRSDQTVHVVDDRIVVWMEDASGPWRLTARLADRGEALAPLGPAPELLVQSFVRPSEPIRAAARARRAEFILTSKNRDLPDLPAAGYQRVDRIDGVARVTIDLNADPVNADAEDATDAAYLASTVTIDAADPMVIELASGAIADVGSNQVARAEAIRAAVFRHIRRKDLGTAFATASETVRSRSGDCSEHAVLLCAALRSQAIPSRVATGLVYADEFAGARRIFAWHMWAQALIDGRWVDLDATAANAFHAAHILISTSALEHGSLDDELSRVAKHIGNLAIEVIDVSYGRSADGDHE
jgi:hypothetical protein